MSIFPVADRVIVEVYAFSCATLDLGGGHCITGKRSQSSMFIMIAGIVVSFLAVMDSYKGHLNRKFRI